MKAALLLLLAAGAGLSAATLPPAVESVLPALADAERQLQDATLGLEAARREAEPAQAAVDDARAASDGWWGRWLLRRRLADLKLKLDKVEAARRAQVQARQAEFTVLTGLEEELRSDLERALDAPKPSQTAEVLHAWWRQKQAWSRRVEALEAGGDERGEADGEDRGSLMAEARLEQLDRDRRLLELLERRGVLDAAEVRLQRAELQAGRRLWRRRRTDAP